jgi:hypothetical protein
MSKSIRLLAVVSPGLHPLRRAASVAIGIAQPASLIRGQALKLGLQPFADLPRSMPPLKLATR